MKILKQNECHSGEDLWSSAFWCLPTCIVYVLVDAGNVLGVHPSYVEQDLALLNTTPCGRVKAHPFIFPSFAQILIGSVDVTHQPITSYSAWRKRENGYCILWVMEVQAHNEQCLNFSGSIHHTRPEQYHFFYPNTNTQYFQRGLNNTQYQYQFFEEALTIPNTNTNIQEGS